MAFVPVYILILGFTIVIDYFAGIWIEVIREEVVVLKDSQNPNVRNERKDQKQYERKCRHHDKKLHGVNYFSR